MMLRLVILWLALFAAAPVLAQSAASPLSPRLQRASPTSILPDDPAKSFTLVDRGNAKDKPASFRAIRTAEGLTFRADNPKGSIDQFATSVRWVNGASVRKGDVLLLTLSARAIKARQESGEAEGLLMVVPARPTNDVRDLLQNYSVGPDWTRINAPFVALRDYAPGEASITLTFGNLEQTIEFKDFDILNFGDRAALSDLPVTRFSYAGREPDAEWRKAALARIEAIRTAPISVRVVDPDGKPVAGAKIDVAMIQPAFLWGSEVNAEKLVDQSRDGERYRAEVKALFDTVVIGNGLKWPAWSNPRSRATSLEALDWLVSHGLRVKGHNLAWTGWKFTPKAIADDPAARANIASLVDAHIRDIMGATRGKLIGWDVVNEPIHEQDYFAVMPPSRVAEWFKLARAIDPALKLTLNEYGMLNRSSSPMMIADLKAFAQMLREHGAEVDILGVQGHIGQTPRAPLSVLSDLDLLAADGHQIQITEFDQNTKDEALQADYTRDFLIAIYSHPAVTGFLMWGFWEGSQWKPDAAMFRRDWSAKPNLAVWREWVLTRWRTKLSLTADPAGAVSARGHLGRYRAVATLAGRRGEVEFDLTTPGAGATVVIR